MLRLCINTLGGSAWREKYPQPQHLRHVASAGPHWHSAVEPGKVDFSSSRNLTAAINIDVCCCQVTVLLLAEYEIEELQAGVQDSAGQAWRSNLGCSNAAGRVGFAVKLCSADLGVSPF